MNKTPASPDLPQADPVSEVMALHQQAIEKACAETRAGDPITGAVMLGRALESKVRELEKDAARWRWLNDPENEWEPLDSAWLSKHDLYGQNAEDLDAFVDAAIDSARSVGEGANAK